LTLKVNSIITVNVDGGEVKVTRPNDDKAVKAMHGLYRKLIFNMVEGVSKGFEKSLILNGVGYKAAKQGKKLVLNVGYSHPVEIEEVTGITYECPSATEVVVKGIDKELVGQMAANIRKVRNPDPYHVYGIRYKDEVIVRKEGKTGKK
jgi:large subunit ribosomal protein L6